MENEFANPQRYRRHRRLTPPIEAEALRFGKT
jgi:hypothetical protein